jgi:hypothetical protein
MQLPSLFLASFAAVVVLVAAGARGQDLAGNVNVVARLDPTGLATGTPTPTLDPKLLGIDRWSRFGFSVKVAENAETFFKNLARNSSGHPVTDVALLAVGAPRTLFGTVFLLVVNKTLLTTDPSSPDLILDRFRLDGKDFGVRSRGAEFGSALEFLDIDQDGTLDLVVGARRVNQVHIFLLKNETLGIRNHTLLTGLEFGLPNSQFGSAVCAVPSLNGDLIPELVIGAPMAHQSSGAVVVVFLHQDASVNRSQEISVQEGFPNSWFDLTETEFGASCARLGYGGPMWEQFHVAIGSTYSIRPALFLHLTSTGTTDRESALIWRRTIFDTEYPLFGTGRCVGLVPDRM